jgi:hypothetical protein
VIAILLLAVMGHIFICRDHIVKRMLPGSDLISGLPTAMSIYDTKRPSDPAMMEPDGLSEVSRSSSAKSQPLGMHYFARVQKNSIYSR